MVSIEIVYGYADKQTCIQLTVPPGTTVAEAINQSGILQLWPEIDLMKQKVGVFSRFVELSKVVNACDRIEIYRPLLIDPKQARRIRAKKQK